MDDTLNWNLPPASLVQMCTTKIAISMVNSVFKDISINSLADSDEINLEIKNTVLENMKLVKIPKKFVSYLRSHLNFVLSELRWAYSFFNKICYVAFRDPQLDNKVLWNIAWTGRGKIALDLTARNMVMSGNFSLDIKYRLACTFHLEDFIPRFWKEINPKYQGHNNLFESTICRTERFEVVYWSFEMMELSTHKTFLKYIENKLSESKTVEEDEARVTSIIRYAHQLNVSEKQRLYIYCFSYALCIVDLDLARYFVKKCDESHIAAILKLFPDDYVCDYDDRHWEFFYYSTLDRITLEDKLQKCPIAVFLLFHSLPSELIVRFYRCLKYIIDEERFFQVLYSIASQDLIPQYGFIPPLNMNWCDVFKFIWCNETSETYRTYILTLDYQNNEYFNSLADLLERGYRNGHFDIVKFLLHNLSENRQRTICEKVVKQLREDYDSIDLEFYTHVSPYPLSRVDDMNYIKRIATSELRPTERVDSRKRKAENDE